MRSLLLKRSIAAAAAAAAMLKHVPFKATATDKLEFRLSTFLTF